MNAKQVQRVEKMDVQMQALHTEIGALSKKTPNDAVNKFKLTLINGLLQAGNDLLKGEYKPLAGFDQFDEDDVPTNSDIAVVLAQKYIPSGMALASGLILGYIFTSGALGALLSGYLADLWGFPAVFQITGGIVLIAAILARNLPKS